jgi:hypothetical protein
MYVVLNSHFRSKLMPLTRYHPKVSASSPSVDELCETSDPESAYKAGYERTRWIVARPPSLDACRIFPSSLLAIDYEMRSIMRLHLALTGITPKYLEGLCAGLRDARPGIDLSAHVFDVVKPSLGGNIEEIQAALKPLCKGVKSKSKDRTCSVQTLRSIGGVDLSGAVSWTKAVLHVLSLEPDRSNLAGMGLNVLVLAASQSVKTIRRWAPRHAAIRAPITLALLNLVTEVEQAAPNVLKINEINMIFRGMCSSTRSDLDHMVLSMVSAPDAGFPLGKKQTIRRTL